MRKRKKKKQEKFNKRNMEHVIICIHKGYMPKITIQKGWNIRMERDRQGKYQKKESYINAK